MCNANNINTAVEPNARTKKNHAEKRLVRGKTALEMSSARAVQNIKDEKVASGTYEPLRAHSGWIEHLLGPDAA